MSRPTWPMSRISGVESWKAVWIPPERVRRARAARDDADPGAAGQLPVRVGHVRRAHLVPADDVADRRVVQRVEHREVALARHAEGEVDAVQLELVDEDPAARPHHRREPADGRRTPSAAGASASPRPTGRRSGSSACPPIRPGSGGRERRPSPPRARRSRGSGRRPARTRSRRARRRRRSPACGSAARRAGGSGSPGPGGCAGRRSRRAGSRSGRSARATAWRDRGRPRRRRARPRRRRRAPRRARGPPTFAAPKNASFRSTS